MQPILYEQFLNTRSTDQCLALWNGCGTLEKFSIGSQCYVAKVTQVPEDLQHSSIKQTRFSLNRKVRSYEKEQMFYQHCADALKGVCNVPKMFELHAERGLFVTLLEDYEAKGFINKNSACTEDILKIIEWLANFHATWMENSQEHSKFEQYGAGNYWHLKTRPDEFKKMPDGLLKQNAHIIDDALSSTNFTTMIHGDAKLANFAFDSKGVLGYDFQHVGVGIGLSDVMLLLTTVLDNQGLEARCESMLDAYFRALTTQLRKAHGEIDGKQVESEWRPLWPIIWADFHRFLAGWKPEHHKINNYMTAQSNHMLIKRR
ncbi:phosphotransferase [Pseudoalteromonas luteoviolacea]|uniref:Aminoglycoside phosphotransferase domain-containing protein n=1 Tax=Pseudoalteromonas luteoviolacea NCIMB 1942 TaxID=1365253 RepID=A0A167HQL7_9GAMM|nr:phosphotransferase [Pseudoalteromonas luteoviolacea]KZN58395.1 hypothetical protein N482_22365 [Pseudoalteromonas luteoviolacea NCIMB 1942]KZX01336.1 hypothetical protein JL49_06375 [Pseudoalteromonas luteoviolacea]